MAVPRSARRSYVALLLAALPAFPQGGGAQATTGVPERAIRRDIPITNAIRRALTAGTRDSTGRPGRNYWQLRTDYTIHVRLDETTSRLTGRESIVLHNNSPDSLGQIGLRLDMNHFRFGVPRAAPWVPAEETDGMVITRMSVNGQAVNLNPPATGGRGGGGAPRTEPTATDLRSTLARINLATPIEPRSTARLEIEWHHKIPGDLTSPRHRMSQRWGDTLYQPTQWYPRVAVYDDLRGWDSELYLGPAEFFNNFGRFEVRIDVPAGWIVSGTGVLQNPDEVLTPVARERLARVLGSDSVTTIVGPDEVGPGRATAGGDRLVWHFLADTVNDFAWATAKKYVWQATRATIPGRGPVPIHMVFLPGRANLYRDAGEITRHAMEFYSKLWFPYEFPQLTLQDGPSAGMEYPMVINSNRGAADHETAHQWWPMVVGTNETWYGWMDEGFNQYMNILSAADRDGRPANLDGRGQSYGARSGDDSEPPMMWNSNYAGPQNWSFVTYSKTPLMLSMLGGIVGDTAVQRAHREWVVAWKFKHPSPWDWMFFMNRALNRDLGWFWYYWLFATESVDGSIRDVATTGSRTTVTVRQDGQMPAPLVLRVDFAATGPAIRPMPNARMLSPTAAILTWPVDIWFAGSRSFGAVLDFGGRAIERITLDPFCRFPDRDVSDNVWPRASTSGAAAAAGRGCGA
ncbi:MAG TPA: M1 family metallopeptidase [Gemmatimonadaceae bacterium]|nr:M1 family metallopeptidase [Gemmatimonadaceae bacterium]